VALIRKLQLFQGLLAFAKYYAIERPFSLLVRPNY
jgi:hypothetical protein